MLIIGHRGARGLAPENTLASLQKALDFSVDEVEVDVRITKDGIPVLHHNRFMPTSEGFWVIADHTLEDLRTKKPDLATLREALELVTVRSVLLIEVKHGELVAPVAAEVTSFSKAAGRRPRILLGSKSQKNLRELHRLLPEVSKVVIEPWSGIRAHYRARQVNTIRISMRSWWLWRGFLRYMHRRGYQLVPYTVNNPGRAAKWRPYIYGVVTDHPDRFA